MKKIIHVNRHFIVANRALPKSKQLPIYSVKIKGKTTYCYGLELLGKCVMIDSRYRKPLKCGATAWIETSGKIVMIDTMSHKDAMKLKEKYSEA